MFCSGMVGRSQNFSLWLSPGNGAKSSFVNSSLQRMLEIGMRLFNSKPSTSSFLKRNHLPCNSESGGSTRPSVQNAGNFVADIKDVLRL